MMAQDPHADQRDWLINIRHAVFGPDGTARDDGRPLYPDCGDQKTSNERFSLAPKAKSRRVNLQPSTASHQSVRAANQAHWAPLSFKLTDEQRDSFALEAALRKMSGKKLFLIAIRHYLDAHPAGKQGLPRKRGRRNGRPWVDRAFRVTQEERDEFVLEAAKRRMTHKELFLVAVQFYCDANPVPRP